MNSYRLPFPNPIPSRCHSLDDGGYLRQTADLYGFTAKVQQLAPTYQRTQLDCLRLQTILLKEQTEAILNPLDSSKYTYPQRQIMRITSLQSAPELYDCVCGILHPVLGNVVLSVVLYRGSISTVCSMAVLQRKLMKG